MRGAYAALAGVLWTWAAFAAPSPLRAQEPGGAGAQSPTGDPAPEAQPGTLRVLVFFDEVPVPGATIEAGGQSANTNQYGSAELTLPPDVYEMRVTFIPQGAQQSVSETRRVGIVGGETNEVIASLPAMGEPMSFDVEGPSVDEAEAKVEAAKVRELGAIAGRVTSIEDSTPVRDARVFVRGVDAEAVTDADGRFSVRVPVGSHAISVIHPQFSTLSRPDIEVTKDQTTDIDVVVTPASVRLDDFVVTAPHIEGSVAGLMDERRASSAVSDAIGREDISKMPANDAAQAAQRVVGATIVGGRFIYVRGLGERYSNALLNGGPLPSPEPDRAAVPLDLFPAQILESLDIVKTFTPDVPGNFAGGSVRIETRGVPEDFVFNVSLSGSYDTQSSFRRVWADPGGKLDWLGFDDGGRALSPRIPDDYQLRNLADKPDGSLVTQEEANEFGPALNRGMSPRRELFGIGTNGSVLLGNGWDFGKDVRFGVLASLMYRRSLDARKEKRRQLSYDPMLTETDLLRVWNDYDIEYSNESVRWGAFATAILELGDNHKISLLGMHSQLADNTTRLGKGFQQNEGRTYQTTRMQFSSRGLTSGQLQGTHKLPGANDALLEWRGLVSRASRDQPDTRDVVFGRGVDDEGWLYKSSAESGRHFFSNQSELASGGGVDWTQPLWGGDYAAKLKFGGMVSLKARDFFSRRIAFVRARGGDNAQPPLNCGPTYSPVACSDALFQNENIGPTIEVQDGFLVGDAYNAALNVYAGYLMADMALGERWRALGGARVEQTDQRLTPFDPFIDEPVTGMASRVSSLDVLPAGSLVFSPIESVAIRGALSKTLARPQLRELAPFTFSDYFGGSQISGNPELQLTHILNADLRLEWYPTPREVFAISGFAKRFEDPIEAVLKPSGSAPQTTFENADSATLYGVEAEARKSLDFVTDALADFTLIGSVMFAWSEIDVGNQGSDDFLTNLNRPLVNQAPYVVNLSLDYENEKGTQFRVLYNVGGRQITAAGFNGLPDAYLQPRHMLDVTASQRIRERWKLKVTARNLLNAEYLVTAGKRETEFNLLRRYREGTSISAGLSFSY